MSLRWLLTEESWEMLEPFEIAGQVIRDLPVLHLQLFGSDGAVGHAEAAGIDYDGETLASMRAQIESVASRLTDSTLPQDIQSWLPFGGARNALDCALWDLHCKRSGRSISDALKLPRWLSSATTACTIGLKDLDAVDRQVRSMGDVRVFKLKVDGTRHLKWIQTVRAIAPSAKLLIDANQSWSMEVLQRLVPELEALGVEGIEQPLPRGCDDELRGWKSPIPLVADESCMDRSSLGSLLGRYQGINIKLDKTGGLTEAVALAKQARALGLDVMVGNMCGTSLGMAAAYPLCCWSRWIDLDGPLLQKKDRPHFIRYRGGQIFAPSPRLWG